MRSCDYKMRFLRWYRVVPMVALVLCLAACGLVWALPTTLGRWALCPVDYASQIEESCERHGVDPMLACAVIKCESSWNASAVSSAGAVGLMQLMPETASDLVEMGLVDGTAWDADNLTDAATSIEFGCAYLGYLTQNLSSTSEIVAAYNAGIGAVSDWVEQGGTIPDDIRYAETRVYLQRVLVAYENYARSYPSGLGEARER